MTKSRRYAHNLSLLSSDERAMSHMCDSNKMNIIMQGKYLVVVVVVVVFVDFEVVETITMMMLIYLAFDVTSIAASDASEFVDCLRQPMFELVVHWNSLVDSLVLLE